MAMSVPQRVRLFGVVGVEEDGATRPLEMSNKTIALLGYMVRQRAAIARGPLAALLWGDTSDYRSRRNLTRALGQIAAEFPGSLRADQQRVQWVASDQVWVDLQDCDMLLRSLDGRGAAAQNLGTAAGQLERAVALYRGEFLADLTLDDCPEFETWLVRERERWRQQITGAASTLISHHTMHGSIHAAEHYARFWLDLEPWQEEAHRALLLLLGYSGRRGEAMAQYDACARALDVELGVRPTEETTLVYEQIKQGLLERSVSGPLLAPWAQPGTAVARQPGPSALAQPRAWSAIPAPGPCYGRERDLATLVRLVIDEECRVIALVGVGGVGKTTLAAQIADTLGGTVDIVLWHSLASAPRPDALLGGLIASLAAAPPAIPANMDDQLLQLLRLLRQHRCLLVLDGWEHFLRPGVRAGEYLEGYEGYGRLLSYLGAHEHQSCLLLTSRELPWGLELILAPPARVQTIGVAGLGIQPARQILQVWGITGQAGAAEELIRRCAGNPLALRIIAEAVRDIFGGQLEAFLQEGALIFDHTRALVEQQWLRLSNLEQEILAWLAVRPGALQISDLRQCLAGISWVSLIEALRALQRRSLVKQGEAGFVLHPLMVEYIRDQLADQGHPL